MAGMNRGEEVAPRRTGIQHNIAWGRDTRTLAEQGHTTRGHREKGDKAAAQEVRRTEETAGARGYEGHDGSVGAGSLGQIGARSYFYTASGSQERTTRQDSTGLWAGIGKRSRHIPLPARIARSQAAQRDGGAKTSAGGRNFRLRAWTRLKRRRHHPRDATLGRQLILVCMPTMHGIGENAIRDMRTNGITFATPRRKNKGGIAPPNSWSHFENGKDTLAWARVPISHTRDGPELPPKRRLRPSERENTRMKTKSPVTVDPAPSTGPPHEPNVSVEQPALEREEKRKGGRSRGWGRCTARAASQAMP
ncbi:hypothetical protein K438DRAFT_1767609 [Mycena galopus ATCC 62051]|nr:hypothetical protein K438DRAFT_1767609 [Mycena galopus ATCC 62051]